MIVPSIPHLAKSDGTVQLVVDGKPYLALAAELQNSSMSSAEHMKPIWPRLASDNINTVLGAVTWEQIEPVEGHCDFSTLDQVIKDARVHGLRLVLLWFGSFKNGLSTYVPGWIKTNPRRFPRAKLRKAGGRLETADILSVFNTELAEVEQRTFKKLMQHLRDVDEQHYTVIMVQVENEIGVLGDSRDASAAADAAFASTVPRDLVDFFVRDWQNLHPSLQQTLQHFQAQQDDKSTVQKEQRTSWPSVFGRTARSDELFMAYHYAQYAESIAAAGKAVYPLPLYTNVWQNYSAEDRDTSMPVVVGGGGEPGVYPSGGGVINVLDVWQVFAPSLDFIAPDIYLNEYEASCEKYRHRKQALFIPEQRRDEYGARRIWIAYGSHGAVGTSPFGIDTVEVEHGINPFKRHYGLLNSVSEYVLRAQRTPGSSVGFCFDELPEHVAVAPEEEAKTVSFGPWKLRIERSFVFGRPSAGCGMVVHLEGARFLLIGWGFQVIFSSTCSDATFTGILSFEEKEVVNRKTGELKTVRVLNGDETRSGQFAIMPSEDPDYGGFPISVTVPAVTGIAEVEAYALFE